MHFFSQNKKFFTKNNFFHNIFFQNFFFTNLFHKHFFERLPSARYCAISDVFQDQSAWRGPWTSMGKRKIRPLVRLLYHRRLFRVCQRDNKNHMKKDGGALMMWIPMRQQKNRSQKKRKWRHQCLVTVFDCARRQQRRRRHIEKTRPQTRLPHPFTAPWKPMRQTDASNRYVFPDRSKIPEDRLYASDLRTGFTNRLYEPALRIGFTYGQSSE